METQASGSHTSLPPFHLQKEAHTFLNLYSEKKGKLEGICPTGANVFCVAITPSDCPHYQLEASSASPEFLWSPADWKHASAFYQCFWFCISTITLEEKLMGESNPINEIENPFGWLVQTNVKRIFCVHVRFFASLKVVIWIHFIIGTAVP